MGIKSKMWRVIESLHVNNRSCIFLEGRSSEFFFQLIRGLLKAVFCVRWRNARSWVLNFLKTPFPVIFFVDNVVRVAKTGSALQGLMDTFIVHNYRKYWHFEANVTKKCTIVILFNLGKF